MMNKINELTINNYTIEEAESIKSSIPANKEGFPLFWPTKNIHGKRIVLTF